MSEQVENEESTKEGAGSILKDALAEYESVIAKPGEEQRQLRRGANPARSRNVLGRGLSALMSLSAVEVEPGQGAAQRTPFPAAAPSTTAATSPAGTEAPATAAPTERNGATSAAEPVLPTNEPVEGALAYLPVDKIVRNETQPRQHFEEAEIAALTESIRESGLLQPIIVRRKSGESGPLATYEIVAGERRWRAAQAAGLPRLPALVRQLTDRETLELAIVENVQRADLNPIEEAQAYQRLITEFGATQEDVAKSVGRDRTSVANALRLLRLQPEVLELLRKGILTAGHGRALLMANGPEEQRLLAERAVQEQLSVRVLEQLLGKGGKRTQESTERSAAAPSPAIQELEERFRRALGTKVKLQASADGKGELRIRFFSQSELESLLERLGA